MSDIAIIGAGAWGTALSIVLGRKGKRRLRLWAREKEVCDSITSRRCNDLFLPGQQIPESVNATNDLGCALQNAAIVVNVVPSHHARRIFEQMAPQLRSGMIFVSATKGVEEGTLLRMSEVIAHVVSNNYFSTLGVKPWIGRGFLPEDDAGPGANPVAVRASTVGCPSSSTTVPSRR